MSYRGGRTGRAKGACAAPLPPPEKNLTTLIGFVKTEMESIELPIHTCY